MVIDSWSTLIRNVGFPIVLGLKLYEVKQFSVDYGTLNHAIKIDIFTIACINKKNTHPSGWYIEIINGYTLSAAEESLILLLIKYENSTYKSLQIMR